MPVFEVEDAQGRVIQLEGDHEPSEAELEQAFADAFPVAKTETVSPSLRTSIPEPGASDLLSPRSAQLTAATQAFPAREQAMEETAKLPGLTAAEAEQVLTTPQVSLPRFGAEGTVARGLSELGAGLVEQAVLTPASPVLALATTVPGVRIAAGTLLTAAATKSAAEKIGEASVTGNPQTMTEGIGMGAMAGLGALGVGVDAVARAGAPASAGAVKSTVEVLTKKGEGDAVQVRSTETLPVEEPARTGAEVGAQVREQAEAQAPAQEVVVPETRGALPPSTVGTPLSPVTVPAPQTPKSQRAIIKDIAEGLEIPIRFGRLITPKYGGYFQRVQNLIASKRANDLPVVTHEAGHKLDSAFGLSADPALRAELDILGDPSTPGSMSSWTKSKSASYKMGEGVAEFVRQWTTDPATAAASYPNTFAKFEAALNANKDFGDVMRRAQNDIQVWRSAEPQARLRSHISIGENPNQTPYTLSQLTRDLVDDLHIVRLASEDAAKGRGAPLKPSQDPYVLARNLRGSYGMADTFIRRGVADFKTRDVKMGTSLQDALAPVGKRMDDFRDWIVAKRAQELHSQGRNSGLLQSDIDFVVNKFDTDAQFQAAFAKVKEWQDSLLQYAEDSGLITPESRAAMKEMNQDYVPFHRVFEVGAGEPPSVEAGGAGRGLNLGKSASLRRLKGSTRDIVDPLESMVKNAYSLITASEKSAIHRAVAEMADMPGMGKWVEKIGAPKDQIRVHLEKIKQQLEDAGADLTKVPDDLLLSFFQQSGKAPFGENIIRVVVDGKPQFYRLNRDLFDTFHALDLEDSGKIVKLLSAPAQVLRAGVTLAPDFALSNIMRDTVTSAVIGKYSHVPFQAAIKGVGAMIGDPKLVAEWAASGGKNAIESLYFDRGQLQKFLREHISKDLTPSERALVVAKSPLRALRWLTEKAEEATRIGEFSLAYDALRKKGLPEGEARRLAAFESRDRQDFAKGGAKTKILRRMTPFWNAALQANVKLASAFKNRPIPTTLKGLAFITMPKLLEQAVNWDDPDYWDRPQWERDLFFMIPVGKDDNNHTRFLRIPTPFEAGIIFGTLPGRMIQWAKQNKPEALTSYFNVLLRNSVPDPIPPTVEMLFETALSGKQGWDIFRGRNIVPDALAELPADLQFTEQTSLTAKKLGKLLGVSPMKVDHLINRSTGGVGKQVTHNVLDRGIAAVTGEERTSAGVVPGGRFIATKTGIQSQSIEDFYANLARFTGEAQRIRKTGQGDSTMAELARRFASASRQIAQLRTAARQTKDENERQRLQVAMIEVARAMNEAADAATKPKE